MNLFCIQCSGTEYKGTPWTAYGKNIPANELEALGQKVGVDGKLWIMQPDNAEPLLGLTAPGKKHFYAGANQTKYDLSIKANGNDLFVTNPKFCVGQKVTFTLNGLPGDVVNMVGSWQLPAKYVNQPTNYSSTCTTYVQNNDLLQNTNQTACWYVRDPGGHISVGLNLKFQNGQYASVAANGDFTVYRPQKIAENMNQDFLNPNVNIPSPPLYATNISGWLTLGDPQGGYARFWAEYTSAYPGEFQEAQIFQSYRKAGNDDPVDSGSQWWNDGAHDKIKDKGLSGSTVSSGGGIAFVMQTDQYPGWPLKAPQTVVNDVFKTYFQFKPSGDGIWVTMGRVNWSWADTATPANIPAATVSDPQYHDDDSFPLWDSKISSNPYGPPPY
jgi:hypothetical protein